MITRIFALILFMCSIPLALAEDTVSQKMEQLLELSLEDLMEVEITTAGRVAEKIGEIPASVILITRQDIETYGYSSIEELLEHVSGMYKIDTYDSRGPSYGVRGFWNIQLNRNVIILVNGVKQVSDYDSNYSLESLPPIEAIDRIEVVRGPMSVVYGNGAFFGVLNLITNESDDTTPHYRISAALGSEQTRQFFAEVNHAYQNGRLALNASTYDTDGLDYPYSEATSQLMKPAVGKGTGGRLGNQRNQVNLSTSYKNYSLEVTHSNTDKQFWYALPTTGPGHSRTTETTRVQLGYQTHLTDQLSVEAKLGYTNFDADVYYDSELLLPGSSGSQIIHSRAYNAELNSIWQLSAQLDIVSGVQYRHVAELFNEINAPTIKNASQQTQLLPDKSSMSWGAFTQLSYQLNEQWKWVGGIRLQQVLGYDGSVKRPYTAAEVRSVETTHLSIIPRLAAIYTPNSSHIFKFLYGNAENHPSFLQLFLFNDSDKSLHAEQIQTLEIDYLTYLSPRYLFNLNLFSNRLQGLLISQSEVTQNNVFRSFMSNAGRWETRGMELSLQAQPTDAWKLEVNMTYQTTKNYDNPELAVAYSPHWLGQLKLAYRLKPQTQLALTGYYVSKMDSYFDPTKKNAQGGLGARLGKASDAYFVIGANLHLQDWLVKGMFANLRLYNILTEEIRYPTTPENSWADKGLLGYGHTVMFKVGYQF